MRPGFVTPPDGTSSGSATVSFESRALPPDDDAGAMSFDVTGVTSGSVGDTSCVGIVTDAADFLRSTRYAPPAISAVVTRFMR